MFLTHIKTANWFSVVTNFRSKYSRRILFKNSDSTASNKYLQSGLEALNSTWDRGLLVKGKYVC